MKRLLATVPRTTVPNHRQRTGDVEGAVAGPIGRQEAQRRGREALQDRPIQDGGGPARSGDDSGELGGLEARVDGARDGAHPGRCEQVKQRVEAVAHSDQDHAALADAGCALGSCEAGDRALDVSEGPQGSAVETRDRSRRFDRRPIAVPVGQDRGDLAQVHSAAGEEAESERE